MFISTHGIIQSGNKISNSLPQTLINNFIDSSNVLKGDVWNASGYTNAGSTVTFGGSNATILGGIGDFSTYLEYNTWVTDRENIKWIDRFTLTTVSATTYGYGMRFHNAFNQFHTFAITLDTGAGGGTLYVFDFAGGISQQYFGVLSGMIAGDVIECKLELINAVTCKFTATNITQAVTYNAQVTYNFNDLTGNVTPVVSKFRSHIFGADMVWNSRTIESVGEYTYPDAIFCFDSKGKGYNSTGTTTANRFVDLLIASNPTKKIYCNSGANETIADFASKLTELLSYKSDPLRKTKIYFGANSNDIRNGTFNTTNKNLLISTFNTLVAANFDVYICYAIPENSQDVTPFNTWASGEPTFTGKIITGTFTSMWSGSGYTPNALYISADNIHPNLAAQTVLATNFTI